MTDTYLKPAKIGAVELRNRVIMGSMHTGLEEHKTLNDLAEFYRERAEGNVGLIITGGIGPSQEGAVFAGGAVMMNADDADKHRIVTDTVHKAGGKIAMQFFIRVDMRLTQNRLHLPQSKRPSAHFYQKPLKLPRSIKLSRILQTAPYLQRKRDMMALKSWGLKVISLINFLSDIQISAKMSSVEWTKIVCASRLKS